MLNNNEILLETTDLELAKELLKTKFEGINVGMYQTRAAEIEPVAKFIIEFLSDASLVFFGHWLGTRHAKKSPDKTTINKNAIPQNINNITIFIKQELSHSQKDETGSKKEKEI